MRTNTRTSPGVATVGFVVAFGVIRGLTYSIHVGVGPFHNVSAGGTHIHHMVWGILLLLTVGYVRLLVDGLGSRRASAWVARLLAVAYGVGAALTLDEFALWLNMRDVYWQPQGWESIGAAAIFACLLLAGVWSHQLGRAAKLTDAAAKRIRAAEPKRRQTMQVEA